MHTLVCTPDGDIVSGKTIALSIVAGTLFVCLFGLCGYIFYKYILLKHKGTQKSMVIFYSFCLADIATRITYFVFSCFTLQAETRMFMISQVSSIVSISAGVCHS